MRVRADHPPPVYARHITTLEGHCSGGYPGADLRGGKQSRRAASSPAANHRCPERRHPERTTDLLYYPSAMRADARSPRGSSSAAPRALETHRRLLLYPPDDREWRAPAQRVPRVRRPDAARMTSVKTAPFNGGKTALESGSGKNKIDPTKKIAINEKTSHLPSLTLLVARASINTSAPGPGPRRPKRRLGRR
jgi:hypothetical protein